MSLAWNQIERQLQEHRREIGWKGGPCVRISLKAGEKYLVFRVVESTDTVFAALTFLPEETIDENPRLQLVAIDPKEIYLIEAFEPEPRRPEQLKRMSLSVAKIDKTERIEKKP
ncbi:MAG TPA: hypothetical protein VFF73_06620 [Planctomycetota bacterium]|nr:hypothetical protein [Planctomycetota bacterium]